MSTQSTIGMKKFGVGPVFEGKHIIRLDTGGESYKLHKKRVVVGSVVSADVRIEGPGVSPIHAVVEVDRDPVSGKDCAMIYDLASVSGVFVGSDRVVTRMLKNGDTIKIGDHLIKFDLLDIDAAVLDRPFHEAEGRKLFVNRPEDVGALLLENEHDVEEIFDYRPSAKKSLEVIMSWHGTILDVQHFVDEKQVTIGGSKEASFGVPFQSKDALFSLADRTGDSYTLNVHSEMSGVVQRKGSLDSLKNLGRSISMTADDFAKVSIGEIDFYLSSTAAPPKLKRRRILERDPFLFRVLMSSALLTTAVITALFQMPVQLLLETEQVPERIATILYQPEKYRYIPKPEPQGKTKADETPVSPTKPKEPPKKVKIEIQPDPNNAKKPVPKEMNVAQPKQPRPKAQLGQREAREGEGARAKGAEGKRGSKNAPRSKDAQANAKRPSPQGGTGRGGSMSQVADQGNVDLLKGAVSQIENILGASSEKLGKSGSKLKGFGGFDTQGNGGLALSGNAAGGGGDAAGLGGLGKQGRGGGRVGTGLGAAGSGSGIVGGRSRVELRKGGPEETVVMGAIDASAIEAALLAHKDEFRNCYEREINAENPNQSGRVGTSFTIGASGRVMDAGVVSSTLKNANTERCILNVIRRIQFPIPRGAGLVEVKYPFKFSAGSG